MGAFAAPADDNGSAAVRALNDQFQRFRERDALLNFVAHSFGIHHGVRNSQGFNTFCVVGTIRSHQRYSHRDSDNENKRRNPMSHFVFLYNRFSHPEYFNVNFIFTRSN